MNAIVPCMMWVPICWRNLFGMFYNSNKGHVDDPLLDFEVVNKPSSDSVKVISLDDDPVKADNPVSDLPIHDIVAHNSLPIAGKYLVDSVAANSLNNKLDDPLSELPVIGNSFPTIDESLCNSPIEDDPLHRIIVVPRHSSKAYVDLPNLPNSLVEDILSRLPPRCIFECQRDSKGLHALTKTLYFAQMQLNRSNPVTVVQRYPDSDCDFIKLYFIDDESHSIDTKTVNISFSYKHKNDRISIVGSYDGFLIFTNLCMYGWEKPVYYLWNSVTNEKRTWSLSYQHLEYVCGFYFCSLRKEYVLLLVSKKGPRYVFQILNLRTKERENVGSCPYPPSRGRPPVIINRTLYWMVDLVMYNCVHGDWPCHSHLIVSFEMETQRFMTVGHSGRVRKSVSENESLHLFDLEGELCMCDPISSTDLELSILNHKTKCWVKRHTVILPNCSFARFNEYEYWENKIQTEVIHYKKGELLVRHMNRLYAYNLRSCTHRIVELGFTDNAFQATVHVDSLVSLANG